jgi:hypothetical protein
MIVLLLGLFFCYLIKRFEFLMPYAAGLAGLMFIAMFLILTQLNNVNINSAALWCTFVFSGLVGAALGFLIKKVPVVIPITFGAIFGYIVSQLLYQIIVSGLRSSPVLCFWLIFCFFVPGSMVLSYFYQNTMTLISYSFAGAYASVRVK